MVPFSEIQQFPDFLKPFPGNFLYHLSRFEHFGIFGWMDSDPWVECLWGGFNFLLPQSFVNGNTLWKFYWNFVFLFLLFEGIFNEIFLFACTCVSVIHWALLFDFDALFSVVFNFNNSNVWSRSLQVIVHFIFSTHCSMSMFSSPKSSPFTSIVFPSENTPPLLPQLRSNANS